ncbi:AMP-binding protein [Kinneretia aquatilis]|uniref:AMP-binding protein n=1 Tax=Kinneretia aquatilis TaxID=2070761 RepID=UPI000D526CEB|nr:AMP-binding protein [Paucibacter aquatile]
MSLIDHLEKAYYRYRPFIPSRLLYHPQYFLVLELQAQRVAEGGSGAGLLQVRKELLRGILQQCVRHVPFYRAEVKLSEAELANEDPYALLQRFPLLDKSVVMSRQAEFRNERYSLRRLHYATSGGSTGEGIGLWRNKRLADIERGFFAAEWGQFGFSFDKSQYLRIGADARAKADEPPVRVNGNRLMLSPYHVNGRHKAAILAALRSFRPQFIHAYPSVAADLANLIEDEELGFDVRAVLLASEPATAGQLADVARVFKCPISVNYGLTERTNIAFARYSGGEDLSFQFDALYGVNENRLIDGRAEIVGTSLWNDVTPLVRYCTKDFGAIDELGLCTRIEGRSQEFLTDRFGGRIPGLSIVIDEVTWDFVRLYQVRQRRAGAITIAVVPRGEGLTAEQRQFVLDAQIKRWGTFFDVDLELVEDIPQGKNGKRKLVQIDLAP